MIYELILIEQLQNLGLKSDDNVMLHASLRAIGKILGGPDQVHQAIMKVIQPGGTLLMYVGCEPEFEVVARGKLSTREEKFIIQHCPAFDPHTARARRDYGALAELFRSWPGVICSRNPGARIAALGKNAALFVADHPLNYGYGPDSPLAKLYNNHGKLLLLGSDLDQVTILHFAEHLASVPEKKIVRFKVPLLKEGLLVWCDVEEYDTGTGIREWPPRFFERIVKKYIEKNQISSKKIGNADSYLIDVFSFVNFAVTQIEKAYHELIK